MRMKVKTHQQKCRIIPLYPKNRNKMEQQEKKELNRIIQIVLYLIIARHAISIITNSMHLVWGVITPLYNIILSTLLIISLILVICKKKIGVVSFYVLQIVNAIGLSVLGSQDFFVNIVLSIFICVIFSALLFIRNQSISGWHLIFNNIKDK